MQACLSKAILEEHGEIISNSLDFNYNQKLRKEAERKAKKEGNKQNQKPEYVALCYGTHPL